MQKHSWTKMGFGKAQCKFCGLFRETERFDGLHFVTVYTNPATLKKTYHVPPCGENDAPKNDEKYTIKGTEGKQLNFAHMLQMERILSTPRVLISGRNSHAKKG